MRFSKKQYRRQIAVFKIISILTTIGLFVSIFIALFSGNREEASDSTRDEALSKYSLAVKNSVFESSDDYGKEYKLTAESAVKTENSLYDLEKVTGQYNIGLLGANFTALHGEMNEANKLLKLQNDVIIVYDGYLLKTNQINIDLASRSAQSDEKVNLLYLDSNLSADKFSLDSNTEKLYLEGNVISHFKISDF